MNKRNIIEIKNLTKEYENGRIKALRGIDLIIKEGEFLAIMGPSGSGKSTLLHMLGALERPSTGEIFIDEHNLADVKRLNKFRAKKIGFIFQLHNLISSLTSLENVLVPMFEIKGSKKSKRKKATELIKAVDLINRINFLPTKLSGGERQRVAIARALANNPKIILADEPTGDVDSKNGKKIMDLLMHINGKHKTTLIVVTHDPNVAAKADRQVRLVDGKIE
jgi:putative ABC transport system ATP-binding protein